MEAFNVRHEIRVVSVDACRAFDTVWHLVLLSKLSACSIEGQLHSWIAELFYSRSRAALNKFLSSPFSVKAGVLQGSVLGSVLCLIFINDLSDCLENPLYLFSDESTLCRDIPHPSDRQALASSLSSDLEKKKITSWSNTWKMSFYSDKSHTLTFLSSKGPSCKPSDLFS